jgi:signal peptidase I
VDDFAIPEGFVLALGDNSGDSRDSRFRSLGPVPLDRLSGRAVVRIWPPWRLGLVR